MQLTFDWKDESFCAFYRGHTDLFEGVHRLAGGDAQALRHPSAAMIENCDEGRLPRALVRLVARGPRERRRSASACRASLRRTLSSPTFRLTTFPHGEAAVEHRGRRGGPDGEDSGGRHLLPRRIGLAAPWARPVQQGPSRAARCGARGRAVHYTDAATAQRGTQVGVGFPKRGSGKGVTDAAHPRPHPAPAGVLPVELCARQLFLGHLAAPSSPSLATASRSCSASSSARAFKYTVAESRPNWTALDWYSFHAR